MNFKNISDFFNGTIFPEEYRTDIGKANNDIIDMENKLDINPLSPIQDQATILILRSLHATMTGNLTQSENYLAKLSTLAEETENLSLISRCRIYQHHILSLKHLPPYLRFRPDANTGSGQISDATLDKMGNLRRFVDFCNAHQQNWSVMERLEKEAIRSIHNLPNNLWMAAFHHYPEYNSDRYAPLFDGSTPCESWFIDDAKSLGLLQTSRFMQRLNAEYFLAGGSSKGNKELSNLFSGYAGDSDFIGAGNCLMILADNMLSLPFTSPIALNMYATDVDFGIEQRKAFGHSRLVELPLKRNKTATFFYEAAHGFFDKGQSDRGKAAIYLRLACLDVAECIERLITDESTSTSVDALQSGDVRNSVHQKLEKAFNLFKGDGPNTQIVACYRVLLNIILPGEQKGDGQGTTLDESAKIGQWGRDNGNIVVSQFVGLLMACVGKKISKNPKNLSMASHCFACSRACFHVLQDYRLELHAIVSQAQLQQQHGNLEMARNYMDTSRDILSLAVGEIDRLIANTPSEDYRQTLTMQRNQTIADSERVASTIYENETTREATWKKQGDGLFDGSSIAALVDSLRDDMFMSHGSSGTATGYSVPLDMRNLKIESPERILQTFIPFPSGNVTKDFKKFVLNATYSTGEIRKRFDKALEQRRVALVEHTDVDEADDCLREFISSLGDTSIINSIEVYTMETVALEHIGDCDTTRRLLPRAIPNIFGGTLPISMATKVEFGPSELEVLAAQRQGHAERSIMMCCVAKDWKLSRVVLQKIRKESPGFFDEIKAQGKGANWEVMTGIACLEYHEGDFDSALDWYLRALQVLETTRSQLADDKDRRGILATIHSGELFIGLAKTVMKFSDSTSTVKFDQVCDIWKFRGPTWMDEAVLFLEKGRARVLLDLLTPDPTSTKFVNWKEWTYRLRETELGAQVTERPKALGSQSQEETSETWLVNLKNTLDNEKESPSLAFIVKELEWTTDVTQLYQSIPADTIVVHINISRDGLLVLGITNLGVKLVHTSDTSDVEMQRLVLRCLKLIQRINVDTGMPVEDDYEPMMETIAMLSDLMIKPISKALVDKSNIIFVPSKALNKFPFSALLLDGKPIFLEKTISIAPSLLVLQHLIERDKERKRPKIKELKAAVTFRTPQKGDRRPLNLSAAASIEISHWLSCKPQSSHTVGLEEFSNAYQSSDVILIATHGKKSPESAWKASITLKTDFEVLNLVKLQSKASLVVFEACLSGIGEESAGNDVLGFSYSVLSSGASSFMGSLWEVSDCASALIMSFLFAKLVHNDSSSFATCLRLAQKQLYEANSSEIISVLKRFKTFCEHVDTGAEDKIISEGQRRRILNALDFTIHDEETEKETGGQTYTHPFFWAPFILVGCGGLSLGS